LRHAIYFALIDLGLFRAYRDEQLYIKSLDNKSHVTNEFEGIDPMTYL